MNKPVFRKDKKQNEYHCILSPNLVISVFNDGNQKAIMTSDNLVDVAEAFNDETEESSINVFSKNYDEVVVSINQKFKGGL